MNNAKAFSPLFFSCYTFSFLEIQGVARTSTITEISLKDFGETPKALENLFQLPAALRHFSFYPSIDRHDPTLWTLDAIQDLLPDHRASLKSIEIGALSSDDSPVAFGTFSVRSFPQLEKLTLSRWNIDESVTAEAACAALLAPNLQHFIWDFTMPNGDSWDAFGREQRDWILKFARLAIAQKSALRNIEIIFTPIADSSEVGPTQAMWEQMKDFWPWDLMDEVMEAVSPDIKVSYNEHVSKAECEYAIDVAMRYIYD